MRKEATTKPTAAHFKHPMKSMLLRFYSRGRRYSTSVVAGDAVFTRILFCPERHHRVYPGGTPCRHKTRGSRDRCQQSGHGKVDRWVERFHLVEDILQGGGRHDS